MTGKHRYLAITAVGLGFIAGFVARRPERVGAPQEMLPPPEDVAARKRKPESPSQFASLPKSTDTVESLSALRGVERYERLALWLLDAPDEEIARLGQALIPEGKAAEGLVDLLFTHWARRDPAAVLAAAKGTRFEQNAWWAWASAEPEAALAASRGGDRDILMAVLWSLTLFHPELALKAQADPALAGGVNSVVLAEKIAAQDPEAAIELLKKVRWPDLQGPVRQWARKDPRAALEWLTGNRADNDPKLKTAFVETLELEKPEELAGLIPSAPPGEVKRLLAAAAFRYLAETDPAAALVEARASEVPTLAAERLAVLGRGMVAQDPQAALGLLGELLQACPDAASYRDPVKLPNGGGGGGGGGTKAVPGLLDFVEELAKVDPRTTMEAVNKMLAGQAPARYGADVRTGAAVVWVARDLEGFRAWLADSADPAFRDKGSGVVIWHLAESRRFEEAMAEVETLSGREVHDDAARASFEQWLSADAKAAKRWLEQSKLPEETRKVLSNVLRSNQ